MSRILPTRDEKGRFLPGRSNPDSPTASNPSLFGEDLGALAWMAVGAAASGAVNDKLVHPFVGNIAPIGNSSDVIGKLLDAFTTAASGYLLGTGVKLVKTDIGERMKEGGVLYGVMKGLSAFVPGLSFSAKFPDVPFLNKFSLGGAPAATSAAPAGNSAPAALPPASSGLTTRYPLATYPHPVQPTMAAGL